MCKGNQAAVFNEAKSYKIKSPAIAGLEYRNSRLLLVHQ